MGRAAFAAIATLCGLAALWLAFATPAPLRLDAYQRTALPWGLACLAACAVAILLQLWQRRHDPPAARRGRRIDLLVAVAVGTLLVILVPARSFIEYDESALLATAQRLVHDHSPVLASHGVYDDQGRLHVLALDLDKRGALYPLLIAICTWLFGASLAWPFVLNGLAGVGMLFLAQRLARRFGVVRQVFLVPCFLASFVAFTITMRGATFDLASCCCLLLLVHATASFLAAPGWRHGLLAITAALTVCQLRYETLALAGLSLGLLQLRALLDPAPRLRTLALATLPLWLVPSTLRLAVPIDYELPAPWFKAWSLRNVPDNLERLAAWLWSPAGAELGSPAVGLLALLGLIVLAVAGWRRAGHWPRLERLYLGGCLLLLLSILLLSYWGQATLVITTRYFIPVALAASVIAAWLCQSLLARWRGPWPHLAALSLAALPLLLQHAALRDAAPFAANVAPRERDATLALLRQAYGRCNVLVVGEHAVTYLVRGLGALSPAAYASIGAERLQAMSGGALAAVVQASAAHSAQPSRAGISFGPQLDGGGRWHQLEQLWPRQRIDPASCQPRAALSGYVLHPDFQFRAWEHRVDRWSPEDPRSRLLLPVQ